MTTNTPLATKVNVLKDEGIFAECPSWLIARIRGAILRFLILSSYEEPGIWDNHNIRSRALNITLSNNDCTTSIHK